MALVVETGAGLSGAESPNSPAEVLAYFAKVGTAAQVARLAKAALVLGTAAGWSVSHGGGYPPGAVTLTLSGGTGAFMAGDLVTVGIDPNAYETLSFSGGVLTIPAPGLLLSAPDTSAVTATANYGELERACRRATRKHEAMYRGRVRGYPRRPGLQALSFPRAAYLYTQSIDLGAWFLRDPNGGDYVQVDPLSVPSRWKQAHAELAYLALDQDLEPVLTRDDRVSATSSSTNLLGATFSESKQYSAGALFLPSFQVVDDLCAPFLEARGKVMRA
jgi:hypothetical protein